MERRLAAIFAADMVAPGVDYRDAVGEFVHGFGLKPLLGQEPVHRVHAELKSRVCPQSSA